MNYITWGFISAVKMFGGVLTLCILAPALVAGLIAGLVSAAFVLGFGSASEYLEWLTEETEL